MPMTVAELRVALLNKLKESCLTKHHAEQLEMKPFAADTVKAQFRTLPLHLGGFQIPYFDLKGKRTKFYRFRYIEEVTRTGFDAVTKHKPFRYGQPASTLNEIYIPPLLPWETIAKDVKYDIVLTEGELKAACGCASEIATLGLGGVWCFGARERGLELLPAFDWFEWAGRQVFVAFDSDAITNPQIIAAENAICAKLSERGAQPHIVRIPNERAPKKTGLDDFIYMHDKEAFKELMKTADPFTALLELHKLNEEVSYIRNPGIILEFKTKQRMSVDMFVRHSYANRSMFKKEGKHVIKAKAAKEWIEWKRRNEIQGITYVPGNDSLYVDNMFNTWQGWGVKPVLGDIRPWRDLIDCFFAEELEHRGWFEQWLAYPLQNPGKKLMSAVVLWSRTQGNGKSTVGETMKRIYGTNYTHIDNSQLEAHFNEWADGRQFVMGDEITGNDRRAYADKLKNLITQSEVFVNKKHLPTYSIPDCINYYFTSNHPDVIQLEECDRRFFIHQVPDPPLGNDFWEHYYNWLNNKNGAAHLFDYLLNVDLAGFNPMAAPPVTRSKAGMQVLSRTELQNWVITLRDNPDSVTVLGNNVDKRWLYTAEELRGFYDPEGNKKVTAITVAREMTKAGMKQVHHGNNLRVGDKMVRLWMVRNDHKLIHMDYEAIVQRYSEERQLPTKKFAKKAGQ